MHGMNKESQNSSFSLLFWLALSAGVIGLFGLIAIGSGVF
jgi:hypothetical protein